MSESFSDYDHENERHVQIDVHGLKVWVGRHLEFNPDYAPDDEPPDDWSDSRELEFANSASLKQFLSDLGDELIQCCFSYFPAPANSQLDSDEAREAWQKFVASLDDGLSGGKATPIVSTVEIDAITSFPR